MGHAALMDRIYGPQAAIYNLTRRFFLLGRERAIERLAAGTGDAVLEIGCGTARNLILAARRHPGARLYGIDVSAAMLARAVADVGRAGLSARIRLAAADACGFDPGDLFGVTAFDRILMSYTLSMIPDWRGALKEAVRLLAPGGRLLVVDFGQQEGLPGWFRRGLFAWLGRFHVEPRADLQHELARLAEEAGGELSFTRRLGGYAWEFVLTRTAPALAIDDGGAREEAA